MRRAACKDWAEASWPDLQPPGGAGAALPDMPGGQPGADGRSPTGETVTIRLGPDLVLEAEGCDELLDAARKRGCPDG